MTLTYQLTDADKFREANFRNWDRNAAFWLEGRMRHLSDVGTDLIVALESATTASQPSYLDMGCGEGWVYRRLRERGGSFSYVGVDTNLAFISELSRRHTNEPSAQFRVADVESPLPREWFEKFDTVINCFNFFELPHLEKGFEFAASSLKVDGALVAATIDPFTQMLSISSTREELDELLREFEGGHSTLGYDKEIDIGGVHTGRMYKGIMYSLGDFVRAAEKVGLSFARYADVVRTASSPPQTYQLLTFKKMR